MLSKDKKNPALSLKRDFFSCEGGSKLLDLLEVGISNIIIVTAIAAVVLAGVAALEATSVVRRRRFLSHQIKPLLF